MMIMMIVIVGWLREKKGCETIQPGFFLAPSTSVQIECYLDNLLCRYFSSTRGATSPTLPTHHGSNYPAPSAGSQRTGMLAQPFRRFQYPDNPPDPLRPGVPPMGRSNSQDQDDTYATPVDTLPSSFGTRVIPSMKKQGVSMFY